MKFSAVNILKTSRCQSPRIRRLKNARPRPLEFDFNFWHSFNLHISKSPATNSVWSRAITLSAQGGIFWLVFAQLFAPLCRVWRSTNGQTKVRSQNIGWFNVTPLSNVDHILEINTFQSHGYTFLCFLTNRSKNVILENTLKPSMPTVSTKVKSMVITTRGMTWVTAPSQVMAQTATCFLNQKIP